MIHMPQSRWTLPLLILKIHYYYCQMNKLLAKYVKIAEVDSGHILELDKSMENMRFMRNMNDQYMNESDNGTIAMMM